MTDPMPMIESILGFRPETRTPLAAETHNVLVDIAAQLRIANQIAYLNAHPGMPAAVVREQIEKELFS